MIFTLSLSSFIFLSLNHAFINLSASLPYGLYQLEDKAIHKGDLVMLCLKQEIASLAFERGYISFGQCQHAYAPLGKYIVAQEHDEISIDHTGVSVNGRLLLNSQPQPFDNHRQALPELRLRQILKHDQYLVVNNKSDSFDSRYFGVVSRAQILGRLKKMI